MRLFHNIKLVFQYVKRLWDLDKGYFIISIVTQLSSAGSSILMLYLPKLVLDELTGDKNIRKIVIWVLIMLAAQIYLSIISKIEETMGFRRSHLQNHVSMEINQKKTELDMAQIETPEIHNMADMAQKVLTRGVINQVTYRAMNFISAFFILLSTIIIIAQISWILVLVSVVFAAASVLISSHIDKKIFENQQYSEELFRAESYFSGVFGNENFRKEIRFFRIYKWLVEKHDEKYRVLLKREQKLNNYVAKVNAPFDILINIKDYTIYLYLAVCVIQSKITIGLFTQGFQAVGQLTQAMRTIMDFFTYFVKEARYVQAYIDFMKIDSNIESWTGENLLKEVKTDGDYSIELKNVDFHYGLNDAPNVLENLNYTFKSGMVYSVIGRNGAGKTTLMNLLGRLYDVTGGEICFNGIPLVEYDIDAYRSVFSCVFQSTHVFAMSIAENIALDKYDPDDRAQKEKIIDILKKLDMWSYISTLPHGIETQMSREFDPDGVIFSGGQLQKIAIARALFRDAKVLLFDEPSSALDPIAEDEFFKLLQSVSEGRMVFYISHRLSSASLADEIIYIQDNRIFAHGKHESLMQECEPYRTFYMAQAQYYTT